MKHFDSAKQLSGQKEIRLFFLVCWLTYFSTYLGRLNFTASIAEIVTSGGFTKAEMGLVGSGFFFGYGIFQLVCGFLGDKLNPRYLVFGGILGSGLLNLLMSFASSAPFMTFLWTLNGVVQSAVWSPLFRFTVARLPAAESEKASIRYSTTVPVGTLAAYGLSAACIALQGWRTVFVASGAFLIFVAFIWIFVTAALEKSAQPTVCQKVCVPKKSTGATALPKNVVWMLCGVAVAALLNGALRDSMQTWMPTYLRENYGLASVTAIVFTLVIPLINLSGVYLGKWLNSNVFHNETATSCAAFGAAGILLALPALWIDLSMWVYLALFGICAALMLAVNTMLVTLIPLRLQNYGRVSALSGLLNSATYAGSTLSGYGMGRLLDSCGWSTSIWVWCIAGLGGAFICFALIQTWHKAAKAAQSIL